MKKRMSKLAIASLCLCIVAFVCFVGAFMLENDFLVKVSLCLSIPTVVSSLLARRKIRKSKDSLAGSGIALLGVIVGWLLIAGSLFVQTANGALKTANALKIGNSGRNVVLSILSANSERETKELAPLWPSVSADFSGTQKDYTRAPDSETYFTDLMDSGVLPDLNWYHFAGAGVAAATNRASFMQGNYNIWNVVAGLDENAANDTPFMFTRNLNITIADLRDDRIRLKSKLDRKIVPFGKERVVWITKGGVMQVLPRRSLNRTLFSGSSAFNAEINPNAKVLKAKGMPE